MPYTTMWEENGVLWRFFGDVKVQDLKQSRVDIYQDYQFDDRHYRIMDFRFIDSIMTTSLENTAGRLKQFPAGGFSTTDSNSNVKVAIVANSETLESLEAYYVPEKIDCRWKLRLFDSIVKARAWVSNW